MSQDTRIERAIAQACEVDRGELTSRQNGDLTRMLVEIGEEQIKPPDDGAQGAHG